MDCDEEHTITTAGFRAASVQVLICKPTPPSRTRWSATRVMSATAACTTSRARILSFPRHRPELNRVDLALLSVLPETTPYNTLHSPFVVIHDSPSWNHSPHFPVVLSILSESHQRRQSTQITRLATAHLLPSWASQPQVKYDRANTRPVGAPLSGQLI